MKTTVTIRIGTKIYHAADFDFFSLTSSILPPFANVLIIVQFA